MMSFQPNFTAMERTAFAYTSKNGKFVLTNALGDQIVIEQLDNGAFGIQSMKVKMKSSIAVGEVTTTKRAFSDYCTGSSEHFIHPITDPDLNLTNESQSLSRKRSHSEEPEDWSCAKRLKHRKNTNAAYIHRSVELGEKLPDMPGQFSLKNEPREPSPVPVVIPQSQPSTPISKAIPEIIDLSGSSDSNTAAAAPSSAAFESVVEVVDDFSLAQMGGDNDEDKPEVVVSARRIPKVNIVKKLVNESIREEITDSDSASSARIEPTTLAITPAASDEQEQKATAEAEIAPKKVKEAWAFGRRYAQQIEERKRIYEKMPLPKPAPSTPQPTGNKSQHMNQVGRKNQPGGGGFKPRNSLGKDRVNSSDGRDSGRQGHSALGFDLHQNQKHARSRPEQPNNRQLGGNSSSIRNGSGKLKGTSGSPVDVEHSMRNRTSQSNNGTNYSADFRNGSQKDAGVQEFNTTENIVKPGSRSRVRTFSDTQPNVPSESSQQKSVNAPQKFILQRGGPWHGNWEIQGDPIVSDGPEIMQLPPAIKQGTHPVVELPSRLEARILVIDRGTDAAKQPKTAVKDVTTKSNAPAALDDGRTSAYFPQNQIRQQPSDSSRHRPGQVSDSNRSLLGSTNRNSGKLDPRLSHTQEGLWDDRLSPDELAGLPPTSSDTRNEQVAKVCLNGLKRSRKSQPVSKSGASHDASIALDDDSSSEDEDRIKKGAIKPTPFAPSKRRKVSMTNKNGDEEFEVLQAFSHQHKWFIHNRTLRWSMLLNTETLVALDHEKATFKPLTMQLKSIKSIELSEGSPTKLILHKTAEIEVAEGEHHVMIELGTPLQLGQFVASLQRYSPHIKVVTKDSDYCDKVFRNTLSKLVPKPIAEDVARIAKLSEKKNARLQTSTQENKRVTGTRRLRDEMTTVVSDLISDDELARSARRGLRSEHQKEDGSGRQSRRPVLAPGEFYNNSMAASSSTTTTPTTRTSSRLKRQEREPSQRKSKSPGPSNYLWTKDPENASWIRSWLRSVVYPPKAKKRTTVDRQDILRLDEGEFLNDNLIHFYFNYMEQRLIEHHPETSKRVLFMNTFFYARLTDDGFDYESVARWTSKVNIFEYDYIVVPVHECAHWYLAIICNTPKLVEPALPETSEFEAKDGEDQADQALPKLDRMTLDDNKSDPGVQAVATAIDLDAGESKTTRASQSNQTKAEHTHEDPKESDTQLTSRSPKSAQNKKSKRKSLPAPRRYDASKPRIITFDSLGSPHSATCRNLFKWLQKEADARLGFHIPDTGPIGMTAKHLPQQPNFCDCGVFLLMYLEKFLEDPSSFVSGILTNTQDVDMVWPKAPNKRHEIRGMLLHLQKHPSAGTEELRLAGIDHAEKYVRHTGENINGLISNSPEPEPEPITRNESNNARNSSSHSDAPEPENCGKTSGEIKSGKAMLPRSPQGQLHVTGGDLQAKESGQRSLQHQEPTSAVEKLKSTFTNFFSSHSKPAAVDEKLTHGPSIQSVPEDPSLLLYQTIENHEETKSLKQRHSNAPRRTLNQVDLRSPSVERDTTPQRNSKLEHRQAKQLTKGKESEREQSTDEPDRSDSDTFINEKQTTEIRDSHEDEDEDDDESMLLPNDDTPTSGDPSSSSLIEVSSVAESSHSIEMLSQKPRSAATSPAIQAPDVQRSAFAPPSGTRKRGASDVGAPQSAKRQRVGPSLDISDDAVVGRHSHHIRFDEN